MAHTLYTSINQLLAPETLSALSGQPITSVQAHTWQNTYNKSGSRLLLVETNSGRGPRYVLKRVAVEWDWQMRATGDAHCRAVALWQHGILDRMPSEIEHGVLACARDGQGWAILMPDIGAQLLPYTPFSVADHHTILEAMAALHAAFFNSPHITNPALNLCHTGHVYTVFGPETSRRELHRGDEVPKRVAEGWELFKTQIPPETANIVLDLVNNPRPLVNALARYPYTLAHGDWRHANLGLVRINPPRTILLDWQLAAVAPPGIDLARHLGANSALLPVSKEQTIQEYCRRLARRLGPHFNQSWWEPQLQLSLLGGFVQDGWAIVLKATRWPITAHQRAHWQADLQWWSEQVHRGVKWL